MKKEKAIAIFTAVFCILGLADVSFGIYKDAKNGEFFDSAYSQNLLAQKIIDLGYECLIPDLTGSLKLTHFNPYDITITERSR